MTPQLILSSQKPDPTNRYCGSLVPLVGEVQLVSAECRAPSGLALSTEVEVLSQNIIGLAAACLVELSTNFREVSQCTTTRPFFLLKVPSGLSFMSVPIERLLNSKHCETSRRLLDSSIAFAESRDHNLLLRCPPPGAEFMNH